MISYHYIMPQTKLFEVRKPEWYGQNITFQLHTSSPELAIHPVIWIKWAFTLNIDFVKFYIGNNGSNHDACIDDSYICTRQCWCVLRGIDNVKCTVNNKNTIQYRPKDYLDPLMRIYYTDKMARTSTSGGSFDSGDMSTNQPSDLLFPEEIPIAAGNNATWSWNSCDLGNMNDANTVTNFVYVPSQTTQFANPGIQDRKMLLYRLFETDNYSLPSTSQPNPTEGNQTPTQVGCSGTTFYLFEPVPVEPFYLLPKFQPGQPLDFIRSLNIQLRFCSDWINQIFQYRSSGTSVSTTYAPYITNNSISIAQPEIHVQYIMRVSPPIPRSLMVHSCTIIPFQITIDHALNFNTNTDTNLLEFRFDIGTDSKKIYFFMCRQETSSEYPTEHFLGIEYIEIDTPDVHHRLSDRQLFEQWRSESINHDLSFLNWRKTKSVCVLDTEDLMIKQRIRVRVKWRDYWTFRNKYGRTTPYVIDAGTIWYEAKMIHGRKVEFNT